jgi:hypothetical protein
LQIISEDQNTILEIILNDPEYLYSGYTLRAVVKNERNPFSGQNEGIHFSAFDSFLRQFAEFIKIRKGMITLEMTEECRLDFFEWHAKGDVGVRAQITKYCFSSDRMTKTSLALEFKLDSEFVNQIYEDFTKLKII